MTRGILRAIAAGCAALPLAAGAAPAATNQTDRALPERFAERFDAMFLSRAPLRYQDNVALLDALAPERLSAGDRAAVRERLKAYLRALTVGRPYAPDCFQPDVAEPFAFLRLRAVELLGRVGGAEDAAFLDSLPRNAAEDHPLFADTCRNTAQRLRGGLPPAPHEEGDASPGKPAAPVKRAADAGAEGDE